MPGLVLRDAGRFTKGRLFGSALGRLDSADALAQCIAWLCRSHDVTDRQGSSKGYSLLRGWMPAYPETTGYVLGTLLEYGDHTSPIPDLITRSREMGDWETAIQESDGGIMEGHVETSPRRSIVFNTGMVLHGWLDLIEHGWDEYAASAERAGEFLLRNMESDGTWRPDYEYAGVAHTYNSRVAWAMVRWGLRVGEDSLVEAAVRQLNWVCTQQDSDGWFRSCGFKPGTTPSTHAVAYTLRGLLESYALVGEHRWLDAAVRASDALLGKLQVFPLLVANYDRGWRPVTRYACLTGTVQLGGVWLRLYAITGDERFLNAGLKAIEQGAAFQQRRGSPDIRGALAGSFPVWGRYAPLQYPNWATKFLADSLMLYERATSSSPGPLLPTRPS